jgi:hypothetical protein
MAGKKPPAPYTLATAQEDIRRLNDERIAQFNRIVATEAMVKTIISELPLETLERLSEGYDLRQVHAMAKMLPGHYRPHLWEGYTEKLQELIALRKRNPPKKPT